MVGKSVQIQQRQGTTITKFHFNKDSLNTKTRNKSTGTYTNNKIHSKTPAIERRRTETINYSSLANNNNKEMEELTDKINKKINNNHAIQTQSTCTVHRQKNNFGQNEKNLGVLSTRQRTIQHVIAVTSKARSFFRNSHNDRIYKSSAQIKNEYWQMKNSETSKTILKKREKYTYTSQYDQSDKLKVVTNVQATTVPNHSTGSNILNNREQTFIAQDRRI